MKLLAEITDESLGLGGGREKLGEKYEFRKSGRAILLNKKGEMATQYLQNHTYHKLPGGGVDLGETIEEATRREVLEEVGCDCEIDSLVGVVLEYRNEHNLLHLSYCFVARLTGEVGEPKLEETEIWEGQITKWLQPEIVLEKMKADQPKTYIGHFILKREIAFLEEFLSKNPKK